MKLWLARHARCLVDPGTCYGSSDVEADPQATDAAATALAALLPPHVQVRSSPLRRCRALAAALQDLRPDLRLSPHDAPTEMDFGRWEGVRWDAIPRTEFERWEADFPGYRFGGRESVACLFARVTAAVRALPDAADVLWITHAGPIHAVRLLASGRGIPRTAGEWPAMATPLGGCECVDIVPAGWPGVSG